MIYMGRAQQQCRGPDGRSILPHLWEEQGNHVGALMGDQYCHIYGESRATK